MDAKNETAEAGHGTYTAPRECERPGCGFATSSRDEYWQHRLAHEAEGEAARDE